MEPGETPFPTEGGPKGRRDMAQANIPSLTAEQEARLREAHPMWSHQTTTGHDDTCDVYPCLVNVALAELSALRAELLRRGHASECNFWMRWKAVGGYVCDCGWDSLFSGEQDRRDRAAL